jgi:hypothetical protein
MHCPPHARKLQFLIGVYVGLPLEDKSRVVEHDAARQLKTKTRMDRRSGVNRVIRVNWRGSNPRFTSEINRSSASRCIEPGFELYLTRRQALMILC